jgi:hypothetical protein
MAAQANEKYQNAQKMTLLGARASAPTIARGSCCKPLRGNSAQKIGKATAAGYNFFEQCRYIKCMYI